MSFLTFRTKSVETLPPDEDRAGDIFSRLGYKIADAIADLVDNSIDAEATSVHIRFVRSGQGIHSVLIADNGRGMSDSELREAMRFGSRNPKTGSQLGRYGIGLKSASLSQAEIVTVLSRQRHKMTGRRWTLPNVKRNWMCEQLESSDVTRTFDDTFGEFRINRSGTVVVWEKLEHLQALPNNVGAVLSRTIKELATELGIRFHRFLESGRVKIGIDQQFGIESPTELPTYIAALDPFGYGHSPYKDYPLRLPLKIQGKKFVGECHIWPARSSSPGYRLGGGKVALRQGFYFYRNDRIIQAGGWNQIRADDSEPHLSLARVKIDLPAALDSMFKLDVTKSRLDPPPEFTAALAGARTRDDLTFEKYLAHAQKAYRHQKAKERARFPVIPGPGISAAAQREIAGILREENAGRPRTVSFKWVKLPPGEVVRPDSSSSAILLNSRYREDLAEGDSDDAPALKLALMFLLQEQLGKTFKTKVGTDWLQRINQALISAMQT